MLLYLFAPHQVDDLKRRQDLVQETSKVREQYEAMKKKKLDFKTINKQEEDPYKQKIIYKKFNYGDD